MSLIHRLRVVVAAILVCAIFLPLSQCANHEDSQSPPSAQALAHARHLFPRSDSEFQYEYAVRELTFSWRGLFTLIAFTWPFFFAFWSRNFTRSSTAWFIHLLELGLCFGSFYLLWVLTLGGRWLYGAYIASFCVGLYGAAAVALIVVHARNALLSRNRGGQSLTSAWRPL